MNFKRIKNGSKIPPLPPSPTASLTIIYVCPSLNYNPYLKFDKNIFLCSRLPWLRQQLRRWQQRSEQKGILRRQPRRTRGWRRSLKRRPGLPAKFLTYQRKKSFVSLYKFRFYAMWMIYMHNTRIILDIGWIELAVLRRQLLDCSKPIF